jgi:putative two-component system response regulator
MSAAPDASDRPPPPHVLVVDDNPVVSGLLQRLLLAEGYEVAVAADGVAALEHVERRRPDLVLLDLDMPRLSGDQVCRRLKADPATQLIPVVIITAQGELLTRLDAWDYGADDFLTKPFHLVEVVARCRSLLRIKRLVEERDSAETVVFALARAVEAKSPYTAGHSERVTRYALGLAAALGLSPGEREVLRKGGLLHDLGKISVPDAILEKPGRLTEEEYIVIKQHAAQGAHIVEPLTSVRDAVPLIRWHHERLDGRGYPDGLSGADIPLLVRLLSVADVYDSLSSERPYRASLPRSACVTLLEENARGGGLDADLVACFSRMLSAREEPAATADGVAGPPLGFHQDVLPDPEAVPSD